MKPLGLKPFHTPGKVDCHPPKGWVNWWEGHIEPNKTAAKREAEQNIKDEIKEMDNQ